MRISDGSSDVRSSDLFYITFTVDEGERYKLGDIDLPSTLPNVDVETLRSQITTRQGEWYSSQEVEQTIAQLTEALANQQYAFVDIRPLITRNRDENLINITYEINERSEERREGKEGVSTSRSRWSPDHKKKKKTITKEK